MPVKASRPLVLLFLATAACTTSPPPVAVVPVATVAPAPQAPPVDPVAEEKRLDAFVDAAFEEQLARSPEFLTSLGRKDQYDRLNSYTDAHRLESVAITRRQLDELHARFDPTRLTPAGRLTYTLFDYQAKQDIADSDWRWYGFEASVNGSPAGEIPVFLINNHSIGTVAEAEAYNARLREVERVMSEVSANIRQQTAMGIIPPQMNFAPVRDDAKAVLAGAPFTSGKDTPVFADFKAKVAKLDAPAAEKARLVSEARAALTGPFQSGYRTFLATWDSIAPQAQGNKGAWSLPNGETYYAHQLRDMTTTDLTADQIHQLGLQQVARIHGEMERIKAQVGFTGTLQQFFKELTTNPKYKYPNTAAGRQQYLADAKGYIAQVMAAAPQWFRRLPKAPLDVRAVEPWRQATASIAFYNRPSPDGSRPGIYYVNLADMRNVLKPQIEAISYHEGAPGHHFQIALAQELPNVPKFRRFSGYGAYSEGWGLYAEGLGKEMGFYQDPISEFGMLSTQLWRAVRLVTDTGIHSKRWSREQTIQYFLDNALLSKADATKEVERYFNWPGQATGYMVGQLKILELRAKAKAALGSKFDIRDFHAAVLENGSLPLDVLEQEVDAYIKARSQR
ncbi:DUF885 domain-containing protein [Sphingomonas sabuli]|uniref:DUF885 domain-containing protein n=1 Tax=Sphingomonas sabuli TaxID=2764186 RepID=A0A7G9L4B3_9SPHN|nr:DUF885 domain-containing protein [Sphingomonas sabuli]QNM83462.1 DUF885 domain-containing protein [Sphingomonas sabuli]